MVKHKLDGNKEDLLKAIDNCVIGYKSRRNREIIKDHYIEGMTFEEVAEKHKMSPWQVKKISYEWETIINRYLKNN